MIDVQNGIMLQITGVSAVLVTSIFTVLNVSKLCAESIFVELHQSHKI